MPINREVTFQSGMMNPAFVHGTVGINILIVSQLPATGSSKYIYAVPGVNEVIDGIPVIRLYIYFNNQWYAITDTRYINANGAAIQSEATAEKAYWDLMNEISVAREVLARLIEEEADAEDIQEAQDTLDALLAQRSDKLSAWNTAKSAAASARQAAKDAMDNSKANIVESEDD